MGRNNKNLGKARNKDNINDEFYTRLSDIENELKHYKDYFKNKTVYCNCDDGNWSQFWRYFYTNFAYLGLKKLIATSYHMEDKPYKYEFNGITNIDFNDCMKGVNKTELKGDGDFRSEECIDILKSCDVVVTNPPFSLFRELIPIFYKYNKDFLVIGNKNAITYKCIFPYIKNNLMWLGVTTPSGFDQPEYAEPKSLAGLTRWFTNINHNKRHSIVEYNSRYNESDYPRYDNYDAIECDKTKNIPCDWTGAIGVPITWLDSYCADQFTIIGLFGSSAEEDSEGGILSGIETETIDSKGQVKTTHGPTVNKTAKYPRIIIKWISSAMPIINEEGYTKYN